MLKRLPSRNCPRRVAQCLLAFAVAACPGNTLPGQRTTSVPASHGVKATLHLIIAGPHRHRARRHGHGKAPKYVSPSTNGVLVQVYAHGAARVPANLIASAAVNVSSGSAACGGTTGYPRSCSASIAIPPTGATLDDFVVGSYDQAPASGAIPVSANLLGYGTLLNQAIVAASKNTLNVFLGGVIDSLGSSLAYVAMPADGSPHTVTLVIDPEDYGNNAISAGGSDPFANPIVVSVDESGGGSHAWLTLGGGMPTQQATLSKTSDLSNVVLHYDGSSPQGYALGATLAAPTFNGSGGATATLLVTTLSVSAHNASYTPGALEMNGNGDLRLLYIEESNPPSTPTFTVTPSGCDAIAQPLALSQAYGGGGTVIVFARQVSSASGCVITFSDGTSSLPVAVSNTYYGVEGTPSVTYFPTGGISPTAMTVGPDANIWFAAVASIGSITATGTSPTSHTYALATNLNTLTNVDGLTTGADGNLWYAGNATTVPEMLVGSFSPSSHTATNYQTTFDAFPFGITSGPDGNLWFAQLREPTAQSAIGKVTTGGSFTNFPLTSMPYYQTVSDIVTGPDGNLWFTEDCESNLGRVTTAGTITEYPSTIHTWNVTVGSDGALWYTDGASDWGRMTTAGTSTYGQVGLKGGTPTSITTGPDGAIWFVERTADGMGNYYIGRVDPSDSSQTEISLGATAPTGPIISGPDGALWFASGTNIGRISLQTSPAIRRHHFQRPERKASLTAR